MDSGKHRTGKQMPTIMPMWEVNPKRVVSPPKKPPMNVVACDEYDDNIERLGDEIANLTIKQANELQNYLKKIHGMGITISL